MGNPNIEVLVCAAESADWRQVAENGGPPCFHFSWETNTFCLRSERWPGHERSSAGVHKFVSLADLLRTIK